jgi:hypothetical protein
MPRPAKPHTGTRLRTVLVTSSPFRPVFSIDPSVAQRTRRSPWRLLGAFAIATVTAVALAVSTIDISAQSRPVAGRNISVGGGQTFINLNPFEIMGDPNRAQDVEPDCDVDSRNPAVIVCSNVSYKLVDFAGVAGGVHLDSWNSIMQSRDGATTWASRLHPGHPLDPNPSVLKQYDYGFDPQVRFGAAGVMFHVGGVASRNGSSGALYASTWVHLSDLEDDPEPVRLANNTVKEIVKTNSGQFQDRPSLAVGDQPNGRTCTFDVPRKDGSIATQTVPCTTAYLTYATFLSNRTKFYFTKTVNGGKGWTQPSFLSEMQGLGQFAQLVKIPNSRRLVFFWRRGATPPPESQTDAIMMAVSNNDGDTWSKGTVFRQLCAFDEQTTPTRLRFRSMPQVTADGLGRVYVVWHERPRDASGQCSARNQDGTLADARVFLATTDGTSQTLPVMVDPYPGRGQQIFPMVAAAAGKVHVAWMDFRNDASELFEEFLDEAGVLDPNATPPRRRHTADMFARQGDGLPAGVLNPTFATDSIPLSKYVFGKPTGEGRQQLQWNVVFARNFSRMMVPFHGDMNSSRGESIVPKDPIRAPGAWIYNGAPGSPLFTPVFHTFWTDGRHLKLIRNEQYVDANGNPVPRPYTPPDFSEFGITTTLYDPSEPRLACDATDSMVGTKNLEIYTSRSTQGLYAFAPWNNKSMIKTDSTPIQRAFVVVVQNTIPAPRFGQTPPVLPTPYRLTVADASPNTTASWKQFGSPVLTEDVFVAAGTAIARTLYVFNASNPRAVVKLLVEELTGIPGFVKPDGRKTTIFINPDPSAPLNPLRPGTVDPDDEDFDIGRFEVHDIEISNAEAQDINAPELPNEGTQEPGWANPRWENPRWENPRWENPRWENPRWENNNYDAPRWENPRWENEGWENGTIADGAVQQGSFRQIRAQYTNIGNTTSSYDVRVVVTGADPKVQYQLIAYKLYTTAGEDVCQHSLVGNTQVLVNIPQYDPSASNLNSPPPQDVQNTTIHLRPGETVFTVLVAFDPDSRTFNENVTVENVLFAARPQAVNTAAADAGVTVPPLVFNDSPFLTFTAEPTDSFTNTAIQADDGPIQVRAQNARGALIPNLPVTMSIGTNPSGGTLSGTLTRFTDASGVASFDDLSINNAGVGYTLDASAPNVLKDTSNAFDIVTSVVVVNTNDSGAGSLRQAILNANANAGLDIITFNIAGTGPHTISVPSPLPTITDSVDINGFSQAGATANAPQIVLNGAGLGTGVSGLTLSGGSSIIRGLVINGFPGPGITISSSGNTIQGNFIGTAADGRTGVANAQGIAIGSGAQKNLVGGAVFPQRNIIGGNSEWGIGIAGNENVIRGNLIGDIPGVEFGPNGAPNGTAGTPTGAGIMLLGGAANNLIAGNSDGTAGNSIRSNNGKGISLSNGGIAGVGPAGSGNTIRFNQIDDNAGLGIDLANDGVSANDSGDTDTGPNDLQNTAVLSSATIMLDGALNINGTLSSTPNTTFQVDYYVTFSCGGTNDRDGRTHFGAGVHETDAAGNAAIGGFATAPPGVALNSFITVTVTNPGGSTSEFSNCVVVVLQIELN